MVVVRMAVFSGGISVTTLGYPMGVVFPASQNQGAERRHHWQIIRHPLINNLPAPEWRPRETGTVCLLILLGEGAPRPGAGVFLSRGKWK